MASDDAGGKPTADVLSHWSDVGDGLVKDKTVGLNDAVTSLQQAHRHLPTSSAARAFVDKFMAQIISILLEQYSDITDRQEKACADRTISCALEIIRDDLAAKCEDDAGYDDKREISVMLDTLVSVFNERNGELWGKMVNFFRGAHGFTELGKFMDQRASSPQFPEMDLVLGLLDVVRDLLPSPIIANDEERLAGEVHMLLDIQDEAIQIVEAVMSHVLSSDENDVETVGLRTVRQVRWNLFRVYLRLSDTTPALMSSFFEFWMSLALKCGVSRSLALKQFGWDEAVCIVKDSKDLYLDPPRGYIVSGAGTSYVNGRYDFVSNGMIMENGHLKKSAEPIYRMAAEDYLGDDRDGKVLTLFKCSMHSLRKKWWFLSEADKQQPGTERDIDYYQKRSKPNTEPLPPPAGWRAMGKGADPPPSLEPICLKVPESEEPNYLENQIVKWAFENECLEKIFEEPVSSQAVAMSTDVVTFLSQRVCGDGDDQPESESGNSSQMQTYRTTLDRFCLKAWKLCSNTADAEISAQICQMLVSVIPTLSDELAISLFQAIHDSLAVSNKCENDYVSGFCRNIDVLTDISSKNNEDLADLAKQIKMMMAPPYMMERNN